ncbi:hypothetical protein ASF87_07245 [Microbacterium sp. Leaf161]|uniref:hypothetical protein n=1 Tax=Microbacterium sp. Leaf161 TaxID=1736281 RepID=UPI0006F1E2B5|nr:hypothetical protein [Microbacterium sp. Leaf161]KQR48650.1 hypothetical protein ASF87_07245 [Microbacterium sp. Leaf161]
MVVYVIAAAHAVGVGIVFAVASANRHRTGLRVAGVLFVGVAVVAGFLLGASAPWTGPILAVVAAVTGILAAAATLGSDPAMREESFGQRVVFALSRRPHSSDLDKN